MKIRHVIKILSCMSMIVSIVIVPRPAAAQTLYGIAPNGNLYTINTVDGSASFIRTLSVPGTTTGLAASPRAGTLYLIARATSSAPSKLYTVNPNPNGGVPNLLLTVPDSMDGLANSQVGDLYYCTIVTTSSCQLHVLAFGSSQPPGATINYVVKGLAVNPADNTIYGTGRDQSALQEVLFKVVNGVATRIGPTNLPTDVRCGNNSGNVGVGGLEFHRGLLYGASGDCLVTVDPTNGNLQLIGLFAPTQNSLDIEGLASVTAVGHSDIWIQDCPQDTGIVPSQCPRWWASDDIWIDNNDDGIIDMPPAPGMEAHVYARVRNRGIGIAINVSAKFYYADGSTSPRFPDDGIFIGQTTLTVPAGGVVPTMVGWRVPQPPAPGGHWCLGVVLESPDDPRTLPTPLPQFDNNIAIANVWSIGARAGQRTGVSLVVSTASAVALFGNSPKAWPRRFVLRVDDQLPQGWSWDMTGRIQPNQIFSLSPGPDKISVLVTVTAPVGAVPRSGGFVEVTQVDVATGTVVGAARMNIYEDSLPPNSVSDLQLGVIGENAVLTWTPVLTEKKTGLKEHIAYYEVFRGGNLAARTILDEDPHQPGMQWRDPKPLRPGATYAVRVVDEAGNVSSLSAGSSVKVPGTLFNWLTWVLLVLVVILLLLLFMGRSW